MPVNSWTSGVVGTVTLSSGNTLDCYSDAVANASVTTFKGQGSVPYLIATSN